MRHARRGVAGLRYELGLVLGVGGRGGSAAWHDGPSLEFDERVQDQRPG